MNYILLALALVALPSQAHAYIDPGAGSMFLQMLIAAVVFGGVMIKMWWTRIKMFFTGKKEPRDHGQDNSTLPK